MPACLSRNSICSSFQTRFVSPPSHLKEISLHLPLQRRRLRLILNFYFIPLSRCIFYSLVFIDKTCVQNEMDEKLLLNWLKIWVRNSKSLSSLEVHLLFAFEIPAATCSES